MVDNETSETCMPPLLAFSLFHRYGLDCVRTELVGTFDTIGAMYEFLERLFMKVASEDINEGEEGSVLYIVENLSPKNEQLL